MELGSPFALVVSLVAIVVSLCSVYVSRNACHEAEDRLRRARDRLYMLPDGHITFAVVDDQQEVRRLDIQIDAETVEAFIVTYNNTTEEARHDFFDAIRMFNRKAPPAQRAPKARPSEQGEGSS